MRSSAAWPDINGNIVAGCIIKAYEAITALKWQLYFLKWHVTWLASKAVPESKLFYW